MKFKMLFSITLLMHMMFSSCYEGKQSRVSYVNQQGDTIAKLLSRSNDYGVLLAAPSIDSVELVSIVKYFSLDHCVIYDEQQGEPKNDFFDYKDCYSIYKNDQLIYFNGSHKDYYKIDDINVWKIDDSKLYVKYQTGEKLAFEQILKCLEFLSCPTKIVYFYTSAEKLEYSSCIYSSTHDNYSVGMFDSNTTYSVKFDRSSLLWNIIEKWTY